MLNLNHQIWSRIGFSFCGSCNIKRNCCYCQICDCNLYLSLVPVPLSKWNLSNILKGIINIHNLIFLFDCSVKVVHFGTQYNVLKICVVCFMV